MASNINVGSVTATVQLDNRGFVAGIKKMKERLTSFKTQLNKVFKGFNKPIRMVTKSIGKIGSAFKKVMSVFTPLRTAIAALGGSFALLKLSETAEDASQMRMAFRQLALSLGTEAPEALRTLRAALKGTVSDMGIMKQVSNAAVLGVGDNIEQMSSIFQMARRLGQATGRTAEQAASDIIIGIGRESRLILDNLGLIVTVAKANENYAKKMGITVESMSELDKRQAFLNETLMAGRKALGKLGEESDTYAIKIQQLRSSINNFGTSLSIRLAPALGSVITALQQLDFQPIKDILVVLVGDGFNGISDWITKNKDSINDFLKEFADGLYVIRDVLGEIKDTHWKRLQKFIDDPTLIGKAFGDYVSEMIKVWINVGKLIGGAVISVFTDNAEVIGNFFYQAGLKFLDALAPGIAALETLIHNMVESLGFGGKSEAELDQHNASQVVIGIKKEIRNLKEELEILRTENEVASDRLEEILTEKSALTLPPREGSFPDPIRGAFELANIAKNALLEHEERKLHELKVNNVNEIHRLRKKEEDARSGEPATRVINRDNGFGGIITDKNLKEALEAFESAKAGVKRFTAVSRKLKSTIQEEMTLSQRLMDEGIKGLNETWDKLVAGLTGKSAEDLAMAAILSVQEFYNRIKEEVSKRKSLTVFLFEPLTDKESEDALNAILPVKDWAAQQIADAFTNETKLGKSWDNRFAVESLDALVNSTNHLLSQEKTFSKQSELSFMRRVEALDKIIELEQFLLTIKEARGIAEKQANAVVDANEKSGKDDLDAQKMKLEMLSKIEDLENLSGIEALSFGEQRKAMEEQVMFAMRRKLDAMTIEKDIREELLQLAKQTIEQENVNAGLDLGAQLEDAIKAANEEASLSGIDDQTKRDVAQQEYLVSLREELTALGYTESQIKENIRLAKELYAIENDQRGKEIGRDLSDQILEIDSQRALIGKEDGEVRAIVQDEFLISLENELVALGLNADKRREILDLADQLYRKTEAQIEEERESAALHRTAEALSSALTETAITGESIGKKFISSFASDFEDSVTKSVKSIADSMGSMFGEGLKKFIGSEGFGQIMGFLSFLQRDNEANITEVPTEDIIASSTTVRGVVAGPENVAISQIGSSIREANRGVESLLTEIRDTLQSIEDSGLTSGGLGPAALT